MILAEGSEDPLVWAATAAASRDPEDREHARHFFEPSRLCTEPAVRASRPLYLG